MYHCNLLIKVFSKEIFLQDEIKKVKPLERFTHTIVAYTELLPEYLRDGDIIVVDLPLAQKATVLRELCKKGAHIVFCTDAALLSPEDLAVLDDVWPKPLSAALLVFYFQRLLQKIKLLKECYIKQLCLDATIDMLPDMVWYKDVKGSHLHVNDAFCRVVGKTKQDIEGRGHYYVWGLEREDYEKGEYVCLETDQEVMDRKETCLFDEKVMSPEGLRQLKTYKTPLFDEDGTIMGTVGIARDVTQEYAYKMQILELAHTDDLTGLANRRYFYKYISEVYGTLKLSLLYLDLDAFKEVNDSYGHQVGDEAIIAMAKLLQHVFEDAFVARIGGDEFLVAFIGDYDCTVLCERVEGLQERMQKLFATDYRLHILSISVGIAQAEDSGISLDELVRRSDIALYQAKKKGKACYCVYGE